MVKVKFQKFVSGVMGAAILLSSGMACASPIQDFQDKVGTDRIAHFGVGYIVSDTLDRLTPLTPIERGLVVAGLGALKEATDSQWDNGDLAATILGGVANIGVHGKF